MDTYVQNVSSASGFPVSIIAAIIAFIAQIISGCVPTPTPPAVLSGGGMIGTIVIYRAMRMAGIKPLSAEGQALLKAMLAEASKASEADVTQFLSVSQ